MRVHIDGPDPLAIDRDGQVPAHLGLRAVQQAAAAKDDTAGSGGGAGLQKIAARGHDISPWLLFSFAIGHLRVVEWPRVEYLSFGT